MTAPSADRQSSNPQDDLFGDFAEGVGALLDLSGVTGGEGRKIGRPLVRLMIVGDHK